jgi:hypothetical protein
MQKSAAKSIVVRPRWSPTPIPLPQIDPNLTQLHWIERSTEVLTYWCLRAEFWLAPGGTLREWIRLNCYAAAFLAVPTVIIVPIVTILLTQFVTWTALLATIVKNLIIAQCLGVAAIAILIGLYVIVRALLPHR